MLTMPRGTSTRAKKTSDEQDPGPEGVRDLTTPRDDQEQEAFAEKERLEELARAKKDPARTWVADMHKQAEADYKALEKANAA
jgi:hypothetical protein